MQLYLAVTPDEFELPLMVCDSAKELAGIYNISKGCLASCISKGKSGKNRGRKFVRVDYEYNILEEIMTDD